MKDTEFVARVRRHRPSALLPHLAAIASRHIEPATWFRKGAVGFGTPWSLAEIARVSLAYGNEHRRDATANDVLACNDAYNQLDDPELVEGFNGPIAGFFLRLTEQLEYQRPPLNELARPAALFSQTEPTKKMQVLHPGWDTQLFGADLVDFCAAGQLLHIACRPYEGRFNPQWLAQDNLQFVTEQIPADVLTGLWQRNFVTSVDDFKTANGRPPSTAFRRYGFNPLMSRPVIVGLTDDWLTPVPGVLARRISSLGIYYAGVDRWKNAFADDLGNVFENYVGRNLALLESAEVHHEIAHGKSRRDAIDYIVVLPEVVVLVEVKSIRPTQPVRMGDTIGAAEELRRMLAKGVRQLERDNDLIADHHEAFKHIPRDRPRVGLLITLEEFHVINGPFHRHLFTDGETKLPITVASASELEHLVTVNDTTPGALLVELLQGPIDPSAGLSLKSALTGHKHRRNAVIDAGWNAGPWQQLTQKQAVPQAQPQ